MSDMFGNHIVGFPTRRLKWRQRPDMTIAVDWDVKHQFKQASIFQIEPRHEKTGLRGFRQGPT